MSDPNVHQTPVFEIILAWGFVGIPLAWGIAMTLTSAVKLFQ